MIQEYLKMTFRYLARHKAYAIINVSGLAIGMAISLLIGLWIWDEVSFDSYYAHRDRMAQVMLTGDVNGYARTYQYVARPLGAVLRDGYKDDFKHVVLTSDENDHVLTVAGKQVVRSGMWVQPDFPVMLPVKMVSGDLHGLRDRSSVLLTASLTEALFGHEDPIGKLVKIDSSFEARVAGVYEDPPANTSFRDVKLLLPFDKWVSIDEKIKDAEN